MMRGKGKYECAVQRNRGGKSVLMIKRGEKKESFKEKPKKNSRRTSASNELSRKRRSQRWTAVCPRRQGHEAWKATTRRRGEAWFGSFACSSFTAFKKPRHTCQCYGAVLFFLKNANSIHLSMWTWMIVAAETVRGYRKELQKVSTEAP